MTATIPACPECEGALNLPTDLIAGELVACDDCGAELEAISLEPLTFELAPEVQEEWGE